MMSNNENDYQIHVQLPNDIRVRVLVDLTELDENISMAQPNTFKNNS